MEKKSVTQLLLHIKEGEDDAYKQLYPLIYDELRQIAHARIRWEDKDHTLSKTDLVHETYLKMIDQTQIDFTDRSHFLAISSRCMRQILIDYARKKHAEKRGGKQKDLTYLDEVFINTKKKSQEFIAIDAALKELEKLNERLSNVVEMRFFGEMTIAETAEAMSISKSTVKRDWMKARGWLYKELKGRFEIK